VTAFCEISGYSSGGVEVFALLGYYTVKVGIRLPTIQDSLSSSMDYLTAEDGTNRLDRNVGTKLPTCTSYVPQERVPLHVSVDVTVSKGKGKGKVHRITSHEGPEAE